MEGVVSALVTKSRKRGLNALEKTLQSQARAVKTHTELNLTPTTRSGLRNDAGFSKRVEFQNINNSRDIETFLNLAIFK